ncbi:uncharacterized protein LOC133799690 [Humulus lupulus]|uniref:uncharacterized protein LOC133799690 n=1 Tax=Humulus lupulus TaxID=3486 RepID=UPI002B4118B9|nr:uncharacterized protein LOC133799690 [Humulus lupulus]
MARRKKIVQKLARVLDPELPSTNAQSVEDERTKLEVEVSETMSEKPLPLEPEILVDTAEKSRSASWAAEVEGQSFQESAKENWSKFKESLPNFGYTKLHFQDPIHRDGKLVAQLDVEEIKVEASFWKSPLICMVIGRGAHLTRKTRKPAKPVRPEPGEPAFFEKADKIGFNPTRTRKNRVGFGDMVLESGMIHFDKKPVILRPWSSDVESIRSVKSVPVWIRLPGLGLQYWGVNCLSALVSTIGTPIMVDKVTKARTMIKFARILVDMEIAENLPMHIHYLNERGQILEQPIKYEWLPTKCSSCKKLGHATNVCKHAPSAIKKNTESSNQAIPVVKTASESATNIQNNSSQNKQEPLEVTKQDEVLTVPSGSKWFTPRKVGMKKSVDKPQLDMHRNTFSILQQAVLDVCRKNKVGLGALIETKLKGDRIRDLMNSSFVGWKFYSSSMVEGRILLIWKAHLMKIEIIQETTQLLHCRVTLIGVNLAYCLSVVYGSNQLETRKLLWSDLANVQRPVTLWIIMGDFNAVFYVDDQLGGRSISIKEMEDARQWLALGEATEMKTLAPKFTWNNKQDGGTRIFSKLDRVFTNDSWIDSFPLVVTYAQWDVVSDHCYLLIKQGDFCSLGVKPFRFFNMWAVHDNFREVVLHNWSIPFEGQGLFRLIGKLTRLKHVLKKFNWRTMGDVSCNYEESKSKYQLAQNALCYDPLNADLQSKEKDAQQIYFRHEKIYSSYLRQKSKITWLRLGDENSSFFHASLKKRQLSNCIISYIDANGCFVDNYAKVVDHYVHHFKNHLGNASKAMGQIDPDCIMKFAQPCSVSIQSKVLARMVMERDSSKFYGKI